MNLESSFNYKQMIPFLTLNKKNQLNSIASRFFRKAFSVVDNEQIADESKIIFFLVKLNINLVAQC